MEDRQINCSTTDSFTEGDLLTSIEDIKFDMKFIHIKAWNIEHVFKCVIREATSNREEADMMFGMVQKIYEIVVRESVQKHEVKTRMEDMQTLIMQGSCRIMFKEFHIETESRNRFLRNT